MRRVKVTFAGREVDFIDRDLAIRWVEGLAERGTYPVYVIYGPEGCGKTAFFRQATEVLKERGYSVAHVNPTADKPEDAFRVTEELRGLLRGLPQPIGTAAQLVDLAIELLYRSIEKKIRRKIALIADDVFQAIGLDKAELLVKRFLNMIEWPSVRYEKIVVLVASSEGVTREKVGRHSWADFFIMWNMGKDGFKQLYDQLPGDKPSFDEAWKWTGGNPRYLEKLYTSRWDVGRVVDGLVKSRRLASRLARLGDVEREVLAEALDDPDVLLRRIRDVPALVDSLVELNLIVEVFDRDPTAWVNEPPPERDPELGIGKYYAWQTPLHREAVRRALGTRTPGRTAPHRTHSQWTNT